MAEQNVERDYIMSKILLLEDDISLVDGLQYSLKKNGFEAEIVRTVSEAINSMMEQVLTFVRQYADRANKSLLFF